MQKFSVEGTVHFQNLKFPNTGDQMQEMLREGQWQQFFIQANVKKPS